jgi:ABC-type antimicrobial peptide transport system permease subunit
MIVNETFAHHFFGNASPLGRTVHVSGTVATIVGQVKDSKYTTPIEAPAPYFYLPFRQWFAPGLNLSMLIKVSGDPMVIVPDLRREALALNQDAAFHAILFSDAITYSLYAHKIAASLLAAVGSLCLLLAAMGLYSVMSYAVSQRTQEFGVRMALGASRLNVVRMVTRESLVLTLPGVVAGIVVALLAFRLFSGMLVGISPSDPFTLAGSGLFLVAVILVASYLPARRATHIDPVVALRCQ